MPDPADAAAPAPARTSRTAQRAAARRLLPTIAAQVRTALSEAGIDVDIFLVVPNSGEAILSFGSVTEPDPDDDTWNLVSKIICQIVTDELDIPKVRTRHLATATTRTTAPA